MSGVDTSDKSGCSGQSERVTGFSVSLWVALLVLLIAGGVLTAGSVHRARERLNEDLYVRASRVAQGLNIDDIRALSGTEADLAKPAYQRVKSYLQAVQADVVDCRFTYLMRREGDNTIIFLADGESPDSPDYSPPGDVYLEAAAEEHSVFDEERGGVDGPKEDRWGVWVSASVPVRDMRTGKVIVLFGMDMEAGEWSRRLFRAAVPPALLTLALCLLVLAAGWLHRWRRGRPRDLRAFDPCVECLFIMLAGLLVTAYTVMVFHQSEQHHVSRVFGQLADSELMRLDQNLVIFRDHQLPAVARMFESRDEIRPSDFKQFVPSKIAVQQAWGWVPVVEDEGRTDFETVWENGEVVQRPIWELDGEGNRRPAAARPVYYPLRYVEPFSTRGHGLHYDLGSEPRRAAALQAAADTRSATSTQPLALVTEAPDRSTLLVCHPVYANQGQGDLRGFVVATLPLTDLLDFTGRDSPLHYTLHFLPGDGTRLPLYATHDEDEKSPPLREVVFYSNLFGRIFRSSAHPGPEFDALYPARQGWVALVVGLLITGALTVMVGLPLRQQRVLERMVAERTEALSLSEQRYAMVASQARTFLWEVDDQGLYTYVSPVVFEVIGYRPDELVGHKHYYDICPPEDREEVEAAGLSVLRDRKSLFNFENRIIARDGRIVWVSTSGVLRFGLDGEPVGFHGSDTDITERKAAASEQERLLEEADAARRKLLQVVEDQTRTEERLVHRDLLLQAANHGAQILLSEPDIDTAVGKALSLIGHASGQDRIYIFEYHRDPETGENMATQRYEWVGEGIAAQLPNPALQGMSLDHIMPRWYDLLTRGEPVAGAVADFPGSERAILLAQDIVSTFVVPIRVDNRFWGFIGLDNCSEVRLLDAGEHAIMQAVAGAIGNAIARRQAAAKLEAALAHNQALLDTLPDMIFLVTEAGVFLECTSHEHDQLFADPAAFLNRPITEVLPQDVAAETLRRIREVKETGRLVQYEYALDMPHGHRYFESRLARCGEHYLAVVRDVTREREKTQELHRLSTAIEQSPNSVVITDAAGNIEYVNPAFTKVTGYSRVEALGKNPRVLKSGEHDQLFYQKLWATITSGQIWTGQIVNRRKDGRLYTEEATIAPVLDGSGHVANFVAIKRDVTDELAQTAALQQAQRMDSIGRLAGGVAHDFNNMLLVILGNTELALEQVDPSSPVAQDLEEVRKAANRSADLTRQLLAFARKQTANPQVLELNQTIGNMLQMLRRLIDENVALDWQPDPTPAPVKIDPSQLDQVLVNLCVNARDAIPETGKIIIRTETRTFTKSECAPYEGAEPGEYVGFSVTDNGVGIESETLKHIFEPFFSTKKRGEGIGLGLATVYGVVRQNDGFVVVTSHPGRGTSFNVYLPRHAAMSEQLAAVSDVEEVEERGQGTILLVEDEPGILAMTHRILERRGYTVLPAAGPEKALQLAEAHAGSIDLLLTDVIMPGMNGQQLAARIVEMMPDVKCLFMSGYSDTVLTGNGVVGQELNFIPKPFAPKDLLKKVRSVLAVE